MLLVARGMLPPNRFVVVPDQRLHPEDRAFKHIYGRALPGSGGMARLEEEQYWQRNSGDRPEERLANGLGWFSIGLGLAEAAAPGAVAQLIGVRNNETTRSVLQAFGVREIASGIAILQSTGDPQWLWARVGGDALDLAALARALDDRRSDRNRVLMSMAAVAGAAAADAYCAIALSRSRGEGERPRPAARRPGSRIQGVHFRKSFTINRQPEVVYGFWRELENLPRFMRHLERVEAIDKRRSRWRAKAPAGTTVSWEAEIVDDRPNERIAWRSVQGSTIPNRGSVRFAPAPGARGTEVHVEIEYAVPGGRLASLLAKLFGEEPEQQVADDLRRLKQILEAGEIARSGGSTGLRQPAQPAPEAVRQQIAAEQLAGKGEKR